MCTSHDNVGWAVDRDSVTGENVVQKLQIGDYKGGSNLPVRKVHVRGRLVRCVR